VDSHLALPRVETNGLEADRLEQIAGERNARRRESALQNNKPEHFLANTQPENALAADIRPFALNASLPWMMTAHIVYPALDPISPATLSRAVIAGTIRGHMGFRGVLVTDDLAMKALSGTPADLAVQALAAGCDLALYCSGDFATTEALLRGCPDVTDTAAARLAAARAMAARRRISLNAASLQDERARLLA
jgi:beta-N-acetylhexosaminidase